jgi:hypothetical protein
MRDPAFDFTIHVQASHEARNRVDRYSVIKARLGRIRRTNRIERHHSWVAAEREFSVDWWQHFVRPVRLLNVTALGHEAFDNTMKHCAVVKACLDIMAEMFVMVRRDLWQKLDQDAALTCIENDQIFWRNRSPRVWRCGYICQR